MAIQKLFPTLIYQAKIKGGDLSKYNKDIRDEVYKIAHDDDEGHKWSEKNYLGGYTSYSSIADLHLISTTFTHLEKLIDGHVKKFAQAQNWDLQGQKLKMTTLWINIMPEGTHHSMHLHPLAVVSGTYYVQTPKSASPLKIEDPRMSCFMAAPPRKSSAQKELQPFVNFEARAGELILFESWLRHEVPANTSKKERVSLSFNYEWV